MSTLEYQPYSSPLLSIPLRPEKKGVAEPAISRISVVGALLDKDHNLFPDDEKTIKTTLAVLQRAGVTISDLPTFEFHNLLPPVKSDFLAAALPQATVPQSDLLIVCGVCNVKSDDLVIDRMHPIQRNQPYWDFRNVYKDIYTMNHNREVSISPHFKVQDAWAKAADKAGIKIVVTRGGNHDEIKSDDFLRGGFYRQAIPTASRFEMMLLTVSGSLGVVVHNDAVAELKKTADPEDLLGRRILAL